MSKYSTAVIDGVRGKGGPSRKEDEPASAAASVSATTRVQLRELSRDELREVSGGGGNEPLPPD